MFEIGDTIILISGGGGPMLAGFENNEIYEIISKEKKLVSKNRYYVIKNSFGTVGYAKEEQLDFYGTENKFKKKKLIVLDIL